MRRSGQELLFSHANMFDLLQHLEDSLNKKIDSLQEQYVLSVGTSILAKELESEFKITVPSIKEEAVSVTTEETDHTVEDYGRVISKKGILITFHVPFEGDKELFRYQPNAFTTSPPRAEIQGNELQLSFIPSDHENGGEKTKNEFQRELSGIRQYLSWMDSQVAEYNNKLLDKIIAAIERRKQKLIKDRGLVASLGYPIRQRTDQVLTYAAPIKRRPVPISLPPTAPPFEPEPTLELEHYDHIIGVASQMSLVMERCPSAFINIDEEALRQHFLVQLNGHYGGDATGETFNCEGKTDILIRVKGKNIFIAECKFWSGEKAFQETIDQILSYSSWRDTKTAIFLFNRNKDFSKVLEQIVPAAKKHSHFLRQVQFSHQSGFRFVFSNKDDKLRELTLTVLGFDIPQ